VDNSGERPAGSGEIHLDRRDRAGLKRGNARDRLVVNVIELEEGALGSRQSLERAAHQIQAAGAIEIRFKCRNVGDETLVDVIEIFGGAAAPPMIAHRVMNNLHQQGARMRDTAQALKRFERVKRDVLLQVFIVQRRSGLSRRDVDESSNFCGIDFHKKFVTVCRRARLYQA
jgi:hypothetical protein